MIERFPPFPKYSTQELIDYVSSLGGLLVLKETDHKYLKYLLSSLVDRLDAHAEFASNVLYKDKPRPIAIGYIANYGVNAFCYASPENIEPPFDFVGINLGVIGVLDDLFMRMLSHPNIFPEIGSPELELKSDEFPYLKKFRTDLLSLTSESKTKLAPQCPIRFLFAEILRDIAIDFLFFHEITHLRNGHLEFIRNSNKMNYWIEAVESISDIDDKLLRQTLEWDADTGAVVLTLSRYFHLRNNITNHSENEKNESFKNAMKSAFSTESQTVKVLNFATYMAFRMFDPDEWDALIQANQSYPSFAIRMHTVFGTLLEIFRQRSHEYNYDAQTYLKESSEIIKNAELAYGLIHGKKPDSKAILSVFESEFTTTYLDGLTQSWRIIRPELEKYKRGGNLPS